MIAFVEVTRDVDQNRAQSEAALNRIAIGSANQPYRKDVQQSLPLRRGG